MPKQIPPPIPPEVTDPIPADDAAYEIPDELIEDAQGAEPSPTGRPGRGALKIAAAVAVLLVVGGALLVYRAQHRRKVVSAALAQADALLRLDTLVGYQGAASLLEPIAQLDAMDGASVRAFALGMAFADYGVAGAETEAETLLVTPGRADSVPPYAQLAVAALALGRREAGNATTAATRAGDGAWPATMQARIAFLAGNVEAALQPAAAAAAAGAFPPGLAVHGDALRRLGRDDAAARAAYEAALAASPLQPRSVYGLAKLALAGHAPAAEAEEALRRLLDDRQGTPPAERGRAALHLATLRLRAGDRPGASAALDAAGLDAPARAWAERAAAVAAERRGAYRAVTGAPAALVSASDDDPPELSPVPPAPPAPPKAAAKAAAKKPAKKATLSKKAAAKKPAAKKPAKKALRRH